MISTIRRRLTGESGQALVEFALVFPFILLPLIIGAFDLSTAYHRWNEQTNLAGQGARYAAVGSWPGSPGTSLASYLCTNLTATDKDLVNGQHPTVSITDLTSPQAP